MAGATGTLNSESLSPTQCMAEWRLVVALDCERIAAEPLEMGLGELLEIEIGRADEQRAERSGARLRLDLASRGASQVHARMTREDDGWAVEDAGSKNGTRVNGKRVARAALGDGDVIECGGTFLVLRRALGRTRDPEGVDGQPSALRTYSPQLQREFAILPKLARSKLPILVRGDTGTGKEVAAEAIHALSRRPGALIAVNCGAIPAMLIESELFGSRRGAFSGAEDRSGLVRNAERGTLFLDEVAELAMPSQVALLRLLQNGEVLPLGAGKPASVDVRVVAATHRPLEDMVESGQFRRDLYARLRGHELHLLPLRERIEDLGLLIAALLARLEPDGSPRRLSRAAARALFAYDWPFHVRELEQTLRSALATVDGAELGVADLRLGATRRESGAPKPTERDLLIAALQRHRGNISAVARELVTSRSQVKRLLEKHILSADAFKHG